jgi:protein tyrosine phosphatase
VPKINLDLMKLFEYVSKLHKQSIDRFYEIQREYYETNILDEEIQEVVDLPICVNCSTGCDNSATFCAISICSSYIHAYENLKVGDVIEKIRERRCTAILNFEQFSFIFEYLNIYAQKFYREKIEEIF